MLPDRVVEVLEHVGANLRRHRTRLALTQEGLAAAAGLDLSHVQRIERAQGNATVSTLVALADALGVKVGALFRVAKLPPRRRGRPPKRQTAPKHGRLRTTTRSR